ncbi:hypothetical protein [Thermoflexibacter ruber]|uniref:Outer membrane protein beta-barrel domain-containing protein n=1 Tax=Thermoflexibacter ruber TaxID=1003 RepID=A0A1I2DN91_9BACT|nr:hypothetical protein [Thermoflexibacter ruber]SFE81879.1 hypothetical protein SAMN04488541_100790 [Thermoflexibacter ruber]
MKKLFILYLLLLSNFAFAQEKVLTTDLKLGVGRAVLGTGDYQMYRFESELTKKITQWVSASVAIYIGVGYDNTLFLRQVNAVGTDLNVFLSPFGNHRTHNFKIGTGLTGIYANITASQGRRSIYDSDLNTFTVIENITTEVRRTTGFSIIVEHEISVGTRYLLGMKAIMQPYSNTDILVGFNLKFGVKL